MMVNLLYQYRAFPNKYAQVQLNFFLLYRHCMKACSLSPFLHLHCAFFHRFSSPFPPLHDNPTPPRHAASTTGLEQKREPSPPCSRAASYTRHEEFRPMNRG